MNIVAYVKRNYEKLPKSQFNGDQCVIVQEICNSDEGWGHHSYEGIGVDVEGNVYWCFSSGCSCHGSCGRDHKKDIKKFQVDGFDLKQIDWKQLDFEKLQVEFADY